MLKRKLTKLFWNPLWLSKLTEEDISVIDILSDITIAPLETLDWKDKKDFFPKTSNSFLSNGKFEEKVVLCFPKTLTSLEISVKRAEVFPL